MFQGEIFIPKKKPFLNLTLSEKLSWGSLIFALFYCLLMLADKKWNSSEIKNYVSEQTLVNQIVGFFFVVVFIASILLRFKEYENLNGELKGKLIIDEEKIIAGDKEYELSNIRDFEIDIIDYYGKRTYYSKSGPYFFQGVSNKICFKYSDEQVSFQFKILSDNNVYDLNWTLLNIICKEKIPFQKGYLKIFSNEYRDTPTFKVFVEKLLKERRISPSEV